MPNLRSLRESLNSRQRALLDELWNHFVDQKEWPIAWEVHSPNRKMVIRDTLKPLSGSIVMEVSDSQHGSRYQMTLLGVLLTSDGPVLETLLDRYFVFLRSQYQSRPKERIVRSGEVQSTLRLEEGELKLLGRLVLLGGFFTGSASYDGKWNSKDWSAGIFEKVEDFPPEGSLEGMAEDLALRGFNLDAPVFLEDRHRKLEGNPSVFEGAVENQPSVADPRIVFVVHGRNEALRKSMFEFLRTINLKPLEWSQAVAETGEGSPYIGHVLDTAFKMAQAIVVLMTPDDEACLKTEFQTDHDEPYEKQPTGQARPNVLFEAGMAMGHDPRRTVLVQVGDLRPFSDVGGRHLLRLNDSPERRQDLADRLRAAGCAVDLSGRDWLKAGSFVLKQGTVVALPASVAKPAESLRFDAGVYWKDSGITGRDGPYCPVCHDANSKNIRLHDGENYGGGYKWFCLICQNGFGDGGSSLFSSSS